LSSGNKKVFSAAQVENARAAFFETYRRQGSEKLLAEQKKCLPLFEALYLLRRTADVKNRGRKVGCEQMLLNHCKD
jgi:hypothetical protein